MYSFIANRQYQKLTGCLPPSLQVDQPDVVYLPSYADTQTKEKTLELINEKQCPKKQSKLKLKKKAILIENSLIGDCCPTCFSNENIEVMYYRKRHICINCRKFLRDSNGNQVKIFLNKEGEITCLGIKKFDPTDEKKPKHKVYYHTDYMKLDFNGKSAFVTFAAPDEMIVLLRGS